MPSVRKAGFIFLWMMVIASAIVFFYRLQANFYQTPIDFMIFLKAAQKYQQTGELYQRTDNYAEKYHPSAAIFKFPPPFELAFVPLIPASKHTNLLFILKILLTGMYFLSVGLIFFHLKNALQLLPGESAVLASIMAITSFWFMPYFESIRWLLAEIPLLLIFISSFLLLQGGRKSSVCSGVLIAYASCIKIYPAFMAIQFLLRKNFTAITGLIAGTLIIAGTSIMVFGLNEHLFYLSTLLPVLLSEEVTEKWVNLNLEKFLFVIGLLSEVNGTIFQLIRIFILSVFFWVALKNREILDKHPFLAFSLLLSTMFFCFPNYWPQYQIYLMIPLSYLYATYLQKKNKLLLAITAGFTATLFIPDNLWELLADYEIQAYQLDATRLEASALTQGTGIILFQNAPLSWMAYCLYEYRALAPLAYWLLLIRETCFLRSASR